MVELIKAVSKDTSGATAVEYTLIAVMVSLACMAAIRVLFSDSVDGLYSGSTERLLNAIGL